MEQFGWARDNLGVGTREELEQKGLPVWEAFDVYLDEPVVDLATGDITMFATSDERRERGQFARLGELMAWSQRNGVPAIEENGTVRVLRSRA